MPCIHRWSVRRLAFALLVAAASVPLLPAESPACSFAPGLLEVLAPEDASDGEAPGAVAVTSVEVTRGRGAESLGCGKTMQSSCDDLGSIQLELEPAIDPDSFQREVGYVIEVVGGDPPEGLGHLGLPLTGSREGGAALVSLHWLDGATDEQEPLSFSVTIRAVDVDGHQGPTSDPIAIVDLGG